MNDDIFPKYTGGPKITQPAQPVAPSGAPVPPSQSPEPVSPVVSAEPRKTVPANPPAKTIFFSQNDINRISNLGGSAPTFRGGRMNDLQSEISAALKKPTVFQSPNQQHPQEFQSQFQQQPETDLNQNSSEGSHIKSIRTFESDVAEVLSHKKTSATTIALAENRSREGSESIKSSKEPSQLPHILIKILVIVLCLAFTGGGIFGAYYLYSKSVLAPTSPGTPAPEVRKSLILSDSNTSISINNLSSTDIQTRVRQELAKQQPANTIRELILTQTDTQNVTTQIPARDMINKMNIKAPDILQRSLTPDWMLGIYSSPTAETSYFVIVTNNFYQNAFAGILQWEGLMADDIKQFLYPSNVIGIANAPADKFGVVSVASSTASSTTSGTASSTASSTVTKSTTTGFTIRGQFYDRTIRNRDVREFRTIDGNVLFLYTFIDNNRLVVAGNEDTIGEMVKRLEKEAFVR